MFLSLPSSAQLSRADFRPDSDIDVLVSFAPDAKISLFDMVHMQDELKQIFSRDVDLISRRGVETSRNYLRRKAILESAHDDSCRVTIPI